MMMPRYAVITRGNFLSLKASVQHDIMNEAWRDFPQIEPHKAKNGAERWEQIARARHLRSGNDDIADPVPAVGGITASEVNDWLASLPPVPFHGEGAAMARPRCPYCGRDTFRGLADGYLCCREQARLCAGWCPDGL